MKKLTLLLFLGLGFLCATAQEYDEDVQISTIFSKNRHNGGYGAVSFSYTQIDGKDAFLMGARGSWIIDHSFAIGLGGVGFINDVNLHSWMNNQVDNNLAGGYGGLYLEPIVAPRFPVHLSFPVLFGVGAITNIEANIDWNNWTPTESRSDVYLVFEPTVELEFNLTRHMRLGGTFGYRFTSDVDIKNINPNILKGYNAGLIFKFGRF
jgi:hypothetical protein